MANSSSSFFYWYRRYKVRAQDMTGFQQAMVEAPRGLAEGLLDASVLKGLDVLPGASGISVAVSGGIAVAATGFLQVVGGVILDVTAAATGSLPTRSLIVSRAFPTDANFINSPTSPFNSVPLNSLQQASAIFLPGTPASAPEYPAIGANDVVLAGLILPAGATGVASEMIDYELRDIFGKNSNAGQLQLKADNRLKPFRLSAKVLGVKPSQDTGIGPRVFTYPGRLTPSVYPLSISSSFVAADSFYNFATGAVSGADGKTPAFTPVAASANKSIVCSVTLHSDDTLAFSYGNEGSFAQCLAAIRNQATGGAGGLATQDGGFPVAFVVVSSHLGVVADIQVFDARGLGSAGTGGGGGTPFQGPLAGIVDGVNTDFLFPLFVGDQDNAVVEVDGLTVKKSEWTLVQISGSSYARFLAGSIPQRGQDVYAFGTSVTGGVPASGFVATGSPSSPVTVGTSGITAPTDKQAAVYTVSTGGAVTATANPRISAGSSMCQELQLFGTSDTNYVVLNDGNGLSMNGPINLKNKIAIRFMWDGTEWVETGRA